MEKNSQKALDQGADILEMRLDRLKESKDWKKLLSQKAPVIITNRSKKEGGHFEKGERKRIRILSKAIREGADFIDLELSADREKRNRILGEAKENGVGTILSFHDFEKVPKPEKMMTKAKKMEELGCELAKIIGFAGDADESIRMMEFLIRSSEEVKIPVIAFAMGQKGSFTRLASPILGSPITYASVEEEAAPGQIELSKMKRALDKLRS